MSDFTREYRCSLEISSPEAKEIFRWFTEHSAPGSHAIGAMFTGAFYFDTFFWPLHVPIVFGQAQLNALECLETMPKPIKSQILEQPREMWRLALYWADCVDYAYGLDDIEKLKSMTGRALDFALSGGKELSGAVVQLTTSKPNTKSILSLRMAAEIFLKAVLIQESNASESDLKRFGHKILELAKQCHSITGEKAFKAIEENANVFPDVSERYDSIEWPFAQVWHAILVAQAAASAMARRYSDRDLRSYVLASSSAP